MTRESESKFRYKVINKEGKLEPWSGSWVTKAEADAWYEKHGEFFEKRGHSLKLVYTEGKD